MAVSGPVDNGYNTRAAMLEDRRQYTILTTGNKGHKKEHFRR